MQGLNLQYARKFEIHLPSSAAKSSVNAVMYETYICIMTISEGAESGFCNSVHTYDTQIL